MTKEQQRVERKMVRHAKRLNAQREAEETAAHLSGMMPSVWDADVDLEDYFGKDADTLERADS